MSDDAFPIITTPDLEDTKAFYEGLGFTERYRFPEDGIPEFVTLSRGSATVGIGRDDVPAEARVSLWVYVDDVDRSVSNAVESGCALLDGPTDQPWGERIARLRDPSGALVVLGMAIRPAEQT